MVARSHLPAAACFVLLLRWPPRAAASATAGERCPAGTACSASGSEETGAASASAPLPPLAAANEGPEYPWPTVRGRARPGLYGTSPIAAPKDWRKKLAWKFSGVRGNHTSVFNGGALVDHEGCVYASSFDGVYKLGKGGDVKWVYPCLTSTTPVIHGGVLYSSTKDGKFFALDMDTGNELWSVKVSARLGEDITGVGVSDGVVIGASFAPSGDPQVSGLNATDGAVLWQYQPGAVLCYFQPVFTGEGTVLFQDKNGGVYHLRTATGELLWKGGHSGGLYNSWTPGILTIGPNRLVYALRSECHQMESKDELERRIRLELMLRGLPDDAQVPGAVPRLSQLCQPEHTGSVSAYRLDSGELAWSQQTPYVPSSQPLVARLGASGRYSLVLPIGLPAGVPPSVRFILERPSLPRIIKIAVRRFSTWLGDSQVWLWRNQGRPSAIQAYDAETGSKEWSWAPPDLARGFAAGEEELLKDRVDITAPAVCLPHLWASPTVDAEGTVFTAHANGKIYALKDANMDGRIDPTSEVEEFETEAGFQYSGAAIADGMLVVVNCDGMYVFKD